MFLKKMFIPNILHDHTCDHTFYMDPNMALTPYPTIFYGFGPSQKLDLTSKGFLHGPILRVR